MITIERLTNISDSDIEDLGKLGEFLTGSSEKIDIKTLDLIVNNPEIYVQIIARDDEHIVGTATLSITTGAIVAGKSAYLQDFVVSSRIQGQGIGSKIWDEMIRWCKEKDVKKIEFTSRPSRQSAHKFYEKHGAVIRETDAFKVDIP